MKIRKATEKDIDFIIDGIKEIFEIEKENFTEKNELKKKIKKEIKNEKILIAEKNKKSLAFIEFTFSNKEPYGVDYGKRKEKYCWINNMYVTKNMRRKKIGKTLISEVNLICKDKKIKTIILDVFKINIKGKKFYKKIGFKPIIELMQIEIK